MANSREGPASDVAALRAYNEAIALVPPNLADNTRSRLYAYRGAILKRLRRLEESQQDLLLAHKWARDDREIDDALYNLACVAALQERRTDALSLLANLFSRQARWVSIVAASDYFASLRSDPDFQRLTASVTELKWQSRKTWVWRDDRGLDTRVNPPTDETSRRFPTAEAAVQAVALAAATTPVCA